MQLLLILVVCLAFFPEMDPVNLPSLGSALVTLAIGITATILMMELMARFLARLLQMHPAQRGGVIRLFAYARAAAFALMFSSYVYFLFGLGWGTQVRVTVVREWWGIRHAILINELLILAPFLIMQIAAWACFYRVDRALHDTGNSRADETFWPIGGYINFQLRHSLGLVLAPILAFNGLHQTVVWCLETWVQPGISETTWFQIVTLSLLAISILVLSPWLLMRIFDVRPLPAGPIRDRLEAAARRLRFRYTKILLWNTRKGVANALVTGLFPIPRYVLLSDCLIENLSPEEVEAVFGHEIGHVKHLHMPLFLVFLMCSVSIFALVGNSLLPLFGLAEVDWQAMFLGTTASFGSWTAELASLVAIGGYLFLVFGFLSRRCERQADIYGARAVSCSSRNGCTGHEGQELPKGAEQLCPTGIRTFISALEKVADLNGIRRDKHSWRHGSIARRVDYLEGLLKDPSSEPRFQRRMTMLRWTVWTAFAAALIATCIGF